MDMYLKGAIWTFLFWVAAAKTRFRGLLGNMLKSIAAWKAGMDFWPWHK